jgi:hypothetical protein
MTRAARNFRSAALTRIHDNPSDGNGELRAGEAVRLREAHICDPGTRGRIVGFYATEPREALLILDDGRQLRVPTPKLERMSA